MRVALALLVALAAAGCGGEAERAGGDDRLRLPSDLTEFLRAGERLEYDAAEAEVGRVRLKDLDELVLGSVEVETGEEGHAPGEHEETSFRRDPHAGEDGHYAVPVVDLVRSVEGDYEPEAILAWLPDLGMFGTWDSGHLDLLVFPGVTWEGIAADPARYLEAQWSSDPPGYYLAPWLHEFPWRAAAS